MRNLLAHVMRRFAVGIDIQVSEVRVVVLSRRRGASIASGASMTSAPIRIEHMGQCALPTGALVDGEFVDAAAIAAAIIDTLCPLENAGHRAPAVMALPSAAILLHELSIAQLIAQLASVKPIGIGVRTKNLLANHGERLPVSSLELDALDALESIEPILLAEAERLMRLESTAIAIDWFYQPDHQPERLKIVAAPRQMVDARIDLATQVALSLTAVEGEAAAALRACRFVASPILCASANIAKAPNILYGAVWIGVNDSYVWLVRQHCIERELRFSMADLSARRLIDHLHTLTHVDRPQQAFIAGDIASLEACGITADQIGEALRCAISLFDAAHYCERAPSARQLTYFSAHQTASFAVAFGLALRGVLQ